MQITGEYGKYKKRLLSNINDLLVRFYTFYSFYTIFYNEGQNYKKYKNPLGFILL